MNKVLILSSSRLEKDPRILRQIRALRDNYTIYTCGLSISGLEGVVKEYPILFRPSKNQPIVTRALNFAKMRFGFHSKLTWDKSVYKKLNSNTYDVIIVNDPREMPLAVALKSGNSKSSKIYFDLHEWWMDVEPDRTINNMFAGLVDRYYDAAKVHSTVCNEIAELYQERYNRLKPYIVKNAGIKYELSAKEANIKEIRLVHHGTLNRARKLETMIDMFQYLDERFNLTFYLAGTDERYLKDLKERAKEYGDKIRFLPPVKFEEIVPTLNQYDIGVYIMSAVNKNQELALPNKMFEFIQARLALAISPNIAMRNLVEKYKNGIVSEDYTAKSFAKRLNDLTKEDITFFKDKSDEAASIENDEAGILTIRRIIKKLDE